jgi:hypothetical protein
MEWNRYRCMRDHAEWMSKAVIELVENDEKYARTFAHNGWDWGEIGASMRFKVLDPGSCTPTRWKSIQLGLRSTHCQEGKAFVKYYAHSDGKEHVITLDDATFTGTIESTESMELSGREDWENLKFYVGSKEHHVLRAFVETCWWANGHVEPIPVEPRPVASLQGEINFDDLKRWS